MEVGAICGILIDLDVDEMEIGNEWISDPTIGTNHVEIVNKMNMENWLYLTYTHQCNCK